MHHKIYGTQSSHSSTPTVEALHLAAHEVGLQNLSIHDSSLPATLQSEKCLLSIAWRDATIYTVIPVLGVL